MSTRGPVYVAEANALVSESPRRFLIDSPAIEEEGGIRGEVLETEEEGGGLEAVFEDEEEEGGWPGGGRSLRTRRRRAAGLWGGGAFVCVAAGHLVVDVTSLRAPEGAGRRLTEGVEDDEEEGCRSLEVFEHRDKEEEKDDRPIGSLRAPGGRRRRAAGGGL